MCKRVHLFHQNSQYNYFCNDFFWQSPEKDQDQMDQYHIQCIMNGICNDLVDLDPFLKIAIFLQ
jgi:hypothetical protein